MWLLKRWFKTSERPEKVHSKWNSLLNHDLNVESVTTASSKPVRDQEKSIQNGILHCTAISMWNLWLWLVQNQWEAKKSPFKMEFYTEPQSQCGICDYGWFRTSERPKKVHSKWNWTMISIWNQLSVTNTKNCKVNINYYCYCYCFLLLLSL